MTYILDTSFIINYFRKGGWWFDTIVKLAGEKNGSLIISAVAYAELRYGVMRSVNPQKEREKLKGFVDDFLIEIIPITAEIAEEYAQVKRDVEKGGSTLDDFDLLIGATAKTKNAVLLTDNKKHFKRVEGLKIYEH
jgi:predicted nucleic acid-binding protein